jgi:hypothetical protein
MYPSALNPEICENVDQKLLDALDIDGGVGHTSTPFTGNGENRVADKLTGSVIGDVTAPISGDNISAKRLYIN